MSTRFVKESRIEAPPQRVFDFHLRPDTFEKINPPWEPAHMNSADHSIRIGNRVEILIGRWPLRIRWVAEYVEYEAGRLFADRQVSGPFASWLHRHWFLDDGSGGTLMRDEVEYELPMGRPGVLLAGRLVRRRLERMFEYRHAALKELMKTE